MAPILRRKKMLDKLEAQVIGSVVIVKIFVRSEVCATGKRKRKVQDTQQSASIHYTACTGFIVDSTGGTALVAVRSCRIDPNRGDIVHVFFHGGITRVASVFLSRTPYGHIILEVKNAPTGCPAVSFHRQPYNRGDLFVLANERDSGLNSYTSNVIHPDTSAYGPDTSPNAYHTFLKTKIEGTEQFFSFSLIAEIGDTAGAAVFDMDGLVAGTITHQDDRFLRDKPTAPCDIKYALHASYFAPKLMEAIEKQKLKVAAG